MRRVDSMSEHEIDLTIDRAANRVLSEIDEIRSQLSEIGEQVRALKRREADLWAAWSREEPWRLPLSHDEIELMSEIGGWGSTSMVER